MKALQSGAVNLLTSLAYKCNAASRQNNATMLIPLPVLCAATLRKSPMMLVRGLMLGKNDKLEIWVIMLLSASVNNKNDNPVGDHMLCSYLYFSSLGWAHVLVYTNMSCPLNFS